MTTLLIILAAAAVGMGIATALRLPVVPLLILVGISLRVGDWALAQFGFTAAGVISQLEMIQEVLVLGLTFLMFACGLELSPTRIVQHRKAAATIGAAQFFLLLLLGMGLPLLMGMSLMAALHVGLAVAASSTIVVVRILQSRRQFFEPFGRLVLGVLLLQDVLIILFIAGLSGADSGITGIVLATLATLGMAVLTWVVMRWIGPWLIVGLELDQESLLLVGLAILFSFTGLAYLMQVPLVVGSFAAGVALSSFPVNGVIRGQLISLNSFFLAIFFVCLGALLVLPSAPQLMLVAALALLILIVTPLLVVIAARRLGITSRTAVESGLLLAQGSEFSIIVVLLGVAAGHLDPSMLSVIALVTVITMILTNFIATDAVTWWLVRLLPSRRLQPMDTHDLQDHIVMLGCGENSRILLDMLLLHGKDVLVVDEDPSVVDLLRARGIRALRGDGADEAVLRMVRADNAYVVISTIRRLSDNERVLRFVGTVTVLVRVFGEQEAARLERMGAVPVDEATAAADELLTWINSRFANRTQAQLAE